MTQMVRHLDLLLTLLPFEAEYFKNTPLKTCYVGHPLAAKSFLPPKAEHLISIFPGSRKKEIKRNLPLQLQAVKKLKEEFPDFAFAVSVSQKELRPLIERELAKAKLLLPLFNEAQKDLYMQKSMVAIAKCGTIAFELALHEVPTVITYALSPFDLFLAKHLFRILLPYYSLPNITLNSSVFPELIGPHFTAKALYENVKNFITSPELREQCRQKCLSIKALLGHKDGSSEAARRILDEF
jgi:lipid-A-disaccharide synthase